MKKNAPKIHTNIESAAYLRNDMIGAYMEDNDARTPKDMNINFSPRLIEQ